jgi:hypothetical protein
MLYQGSTLSDTPLAIDELQLSTELECVSLPILSIGVVRDLIARAYVRPFEKATKTIVLEVGQIAPAAQQAMLKILEEPPETTRFIIVIPSFDNLLGTLRSRLYQPLDNREMSISPHVLFAEFMARPYAERFSMIADIAKAKDSADFEELARGLRNWLIQAPVSPLSITLHDWLQVLPKRGSSKKMLWEDIALRLPVARP